MTLVLGRTRAIVSHSARLLVTGGQDTLVTMEYLSMVTMDTVMARVARVANDDRVSSTRDHGEGVTEPVRTLSSALIMIKTQCQLSTKLDSFTN